jgi:hypothetical protein
MSAAVPGDADVEPADAGEMGERAVIERWGGRHVGPDPDEPDHVDVWLPGGQPVDAKACALRVRDGDTTRRGRFWIDVANHRLLDDSGGLYAFAVYDPAGPEVLSIQLIRAARLPEHVPGLKIDPERTGSRVQIRFPELFPQLESRFNDRLNTGETA